jgi:hypothetical protein
MITPVLDSFEIGSPNDTHACYITIMVSGSLSDARDGSYNRLFHLDVARAGDIASHCSRARELSRIFCAATSTMEILFFSFATPWID